MEYEFWKCVCVDREDKMSCEHYDFDGNCSRTSYAIPKVSEYKGDVWEEARKECREHLKGKTFSDTADYYLEMLNYLEQHYTLTKI